MATVTRSGSLISIGDKVRVERGPAFQTAIATAELLDNETTAGHYAVGLPDALGKPIVLGEEFAYLDYGGTVAEGKHVHYVYELVELTDEERNAEGAETTDTHRWVERGTRVSEESAITFGQSIAGD